MTRCALKPGTVCRGATTARPVPTVGALWWDGCCGLGSHGCFPREPIGQRVTDLGRQMIRNIAMRFDAYLGKEKERRYSKTI